MASKYPTTVTSKDDFLQCTMCHQQFNNGERHPRLLRCFHSLCYLCLSEGVGLGTYIKCPSCGANSPTKNGTDAFPRDSVRQQQHAIENFKIGHNTCLQCGEDEAIVHCAECSDLLCGKCRDAHKRTKLTSRHSVRKLSELAKDLKPEHLWTSAKCQAHGHEHNMLELYCAGPNCRTSVCTVCALTKHKEPLEHDVVDLKEVYNTRKSHVTKVTQNASSKREAVQQAMCAVREEAENVEKSKQDCLRATDVQFSNCVAAITKRRDELKERIDSICTQKKAALQRQEATLETLSTDLDMAVDFSGMAITTVSPTDFLQLDKQIDQQLTYLCDKDFDEMPHETASVSLDPKQMGTAFYRFVGGMGEIRASSVFPPNTVVKTHKGKIDVCKTILTLCLVDAGNNPVADRDVPVEVCVTDDSGEVTRLEAQYCESGSSYKVDFTAKSATPHEVSVSVDGMALRRQITLEVEDVTESDHVTDDGLSVIAESQQQSMSGELGQVSPEARPSLRFRAREDTTKKLQYLRSNLKRKSQIRQRLKSYGATMIWPEDFNDAVTFTVAFVSEAKKRKCSDDVVAFLREMLGKIEASRHIVSKQAWTNVVKELQQVSIQDPESVAVFLGVKTGDIWTAGLPAGVKQVDSVIKRIIQNISAGATM